MDNEWGNMAAFKFVQFGNSLEHSGSLCHDDRVADFGGNDGYVANQFYLAHKIKPLVVDCEPRRLDYAGKRYGLQTYEAFVEDMKDLADKSIDWGFCSHTLEHTRDVAKALREIARVVKRGAYFVVPIEGKKHASENHGHAISFVRMKDWEDVLEENGWKIIKSFMPGEHEAQFFAEPV